MTNECMSAILAAVVEQHPMIYLIVWGEQSYSGVISTPPSIAFEIVNTANDVVANSQSELSASRRPGSVGVQ